MLEWVGDIIKESWKEVNPFVIRRDYEDGVLLRLGKYHHNLKRGLSFKIPFIDEVHSCVVTENTMHLADVNVTTTDNKTVLAAAVVVYEIYNAKTYLLDFNETDSNAHDIFSKIITFEIADMDFAELKNKPTLTKIKNKLKSEAERMGIRILDFGWDSLCIVRVLKLFNEH